MIKKRKERKKEKSISTVTAYIFFSLRHFKDSVRSRNLSSVLRSGIENFPLNIMCIVIKKGLQEDLKEFLYTTV